MLNDRKINAWANPIASEADRPNRSAADMKRIFDSNTNELKDALNGAIDDVQAGEVALSFTQAAERAPIESGESLGTVLGKVSKFMRDAEAAVQTIKIDAGKTNRFLCLDGSYSVPEAGEAVNGLPMGGLPGQVLVKETDGDYAAQWQNIVNTVNGAHGDVALTPSDIGAVADPTSKTAGQFLKWDGSMWVAESIQQGIVTDLLWENASPTSGFGEQTVALPTRGEYKVICAEFRMNPSNGRLYPLMMPANGTYQAVLVNPQSSKLYAYTRTASLDDGGVYFQSGWLGHTTSTGNQDATCMIPFRIFGLK
ncbi:MAG: hypothetical protein Q4C53_08090 [Clostridia bacterium]|nr:hypothetical protein [Clostridia bacterium]